MGGTGRGRLVWHLWSPDSRYDHSYSSSSTDSPVTIPEVSDDCLSPPCKGVVLAVREAGVLIDPDVGKCHACGLAYRRRGGAWTVDRPVLVSFQGTYGIESHHCDAVSFENAAGMVTFTPSDGSPARTILRKYLVEIVPTL